MWHARHTLISKPILCRYNHNGSSLCKYTRISKNIGMKSPISQPAINWFAAAPAPFPKYSETRKNSHPTVFLRHPVPSPNRGLCH